jgi:hypothetical protein
MRNEGGRKDGKCSENAWYRGDRCPLVFYGVCCHLVLNLFPFPLTPAQLVGDGLPIKLCAANVTLALITHQYSGAANHVAPLQWCC